MIEVSKEFVSYLTSVDWFSNSGVYNNLCGELTTAKSIDSIIKNISSSRWLNRRLDAQGDVTEYLCINHRAEYQLWNSVVKEANQFIDELLKDKISDKLTEIGLTDAVIFENVVRDIRMIIVMNTWKVFVDSDFYNRLLDIYVSGYLPCGWKGTKSEGKLIIY